MMGHCMIDQVAMIHQGMGDTHAIWPTAHITSCRVVPRYDGSDEVEQLAESISETDFHPIKHQKI